MKKSIYIFGAGGLGREIAALIRSLSDWDLKGFYDDGKGKGELIDSVPCVGGLNDLLKVTGDIQIIIGVGDPVVKSEIVKKLFLFGNIKYPALIHPDARILDPDRVSIGWGSVVTAGSVLTTGIAVGIHTLINLNTTIGHDCTIGNGCSIMPGVHMAGGVKMGNGVLVGSGANILNGITIGDNARIGAGSVVLENVASGATVMGVPARESKKG